jgi:hypothetical protein
MIEQQQQRVAFERRPGAFTPRDPKKAMTCWPSVTGEFDAKLPYCGW